MKRLAGSFTLVLLLTAAAGCDSGDKKDGDKKADAKSGDAKADGGDKAAAEGGEAAAEGGEAGEAKPAEPVKLSELSLEDAGLDATIQAPEGAKASAEMGNFVVTAGESFQLEIHGGKADIAARKGEAGDGVVSESETELVYSKDVDGKAEFHFVANVQLDGADYNCGDKEGQTFAQADVEAMLAACKSLKALE